MRPLRHKILLAFNCLVAIWALSACGSDFAFAKPVLEASVTEGVALLEVTFTNGTPLATESAPDLRWFWFEMEVPPDRGVYDINGSEYVTEEGVFYLNRDSYARLSFEQPGKYVIELTVYYDGSPPGVDPALMDGPIVQRVFFSTSKTIEVHP